MLPELRITNASARKALENRVFINDDKGLSEHVEALITCKSLGLDTEFVRDRTFFPKPGLLQFSDGQNIWLIDPIALADSHAFKDFLSTLLSDSSRVKILHSVGEDFEVLELLAGQYPLPLFDTQIAAAMLGWPLQMRYENLASELLEVDFPGGLARNNWCKRPLPDAWLEYAAHDVIALPAMRSVLEAKLSEMGRLEWMLEDCQRSVDQASQHTSAVVRVKAASRLDDQSLVVLTALAKWRDEQARLRDLPRSFVVRDDVLLALSRTRPDSTAKLEQIEGIHPGFVSRFSKTLLELVQTEDEHFIRPVELEPLTTEQQNIIKKMQQTVRELAEKLNVEAPLIASRRELTRLLQTGQVDWMDGWRAELLDGAFDQWLEA